MSLDRIVWVSLAILLLLGGFLASQHFFSPAQHGSSDPFRQWFWEERGLDLLVQAGLIFAGALGIAALLPRGKEDE